MRGERSTAGGHSLPRGSATVRCDFLWGPTDTIIKEPGALDTAQEIYGDSDVIHKDGWEEMTWNKLVLHEFEGFSRNDEFLKYCKNISPKFIIIME